MLTNNNYLIIWYITIYFFYRKNVYIGFTMWHLIKFHAFVAMWLLERKCWSMMWKMKRKAWNGKKSLIPFFFWLSFVSASMEMKNSECFVKGIKKHVLHFATWSLTCTTTWRRIWLLLRKIISRMKLNTFTFKWKTYNYSQHNLNSFLFMEWKKKKNYVYSIQKNLVHFSVIEWARCFDGFWNKYIYTHKRTGICKKKAVILVYFIINIVLNVISKS